MTPAPVEVRFAAMLRKDAAEAWARRRIEQIEQERPGALRWSVLCEQPRMLDPSQPAYGVRVEVQLRDGGTLCAQCSGPDLLAALDMALDALRPG